MNASIRSKLEQISDRYQEITALLADPAIQADGNGFRDLSREYAQIEPLSLCYQRYVTAETVDIMVRGGSVIRTKCKIQRIIPGDFVHHIQRAIKDYYRTP